MPTVSEGLGMKEANTTSTFLRQMSILLAQAIQNSKKHGYVDEHMKGARAILKHINSGGSTRYQMVKPEDAAIYEKILKNKRVPYVRLTSPDGNEVFATRDCDSKLVEQAWEMLASELKIGFKEQTPHEFLNDNAGQKVFQIIGYNEVELEVFRREAAKLGFNYAVVGNEKEKGKYDILHSERDNSAASKAFRALEYELSGEAGEKLRKKIQASLDVKNQVLRTAKEKPKDIQYLVNRNNPMQFITLSDGIMVEHALSLEEKRGRDGQVSKVVKDKTRRTQPFGNREVTLAMKAYGECAVIPKEQMDFIKGYDSVGSAIILDYLELGKALAELDESMKASTYPVYAASITRSDITAKDKVCTLSNVEAEKLLQVTETLKKENITYVSIGEDFAFWEKDKAKVECILDKTLYRGLSFRDKFQAMLYYEGRGSEQLDLNRLPEPVYITSAINPEYVLKLDQSGYALLLNGEAVLDLGKDSPKFEEQLEAMLDSMEEIAVLSQQEIEHSPEERVQLIEERAEIKENAASKQYALNYEERKERFLNADFETMPPEEQELIRRCFEHKTVISFVDRSLGERMSDRVLQEQLMEHTKTRKTKEPER